MKRKTLGMLVLSMTLGYMPVQAIAQVVSQPVDLTYAAEKAVSSVVYIKATINSKTQTVEYYNPFEDFFGDFFGRGNQGKSQRQVQTPKRQGAGSGVIISDDGYIVTNNHVVDSADELLVKLNDNREFRARIIGQDKDTDLALIKIEGNDFPAITIGNSDDLKLGEWVLAVGNPFNLTSTVTAGIVSAKARTLGANSLESFIQTDAAINRGNSGGALVNAKGELVGINAMLYSQTGSFSGYGFAIPTTIMTRVVNDIKEFGTVQRAMLGIMGQDVINYIDAQKEEGKGIDLGTSTGIYIKEVSGDGAAADAKLQEGDVIIAINGKDIDKMAELQEELIKFRPGDEISITYLRDKKNTTVKTTLRNAQGTTTAMDKIEDTFLGAALRPLTDEEKRELNLSYGLVVSAVRDGKMKDAGITKGLIILQINDEQMRTLEDFEAAVKAANMTTDRILWIRAKTMSGIPKSFTVELGDSKEEAKAKK